MNYCWKCGEKNPSDGTCQACGTSPLARLPLPEDSGKEALAMRRVYDRHGRNRTLSESDLLCDALDEALGEEGKTLRNQVRIALDAGLGALYCDELTQPGPDFTQNATALLTGAGLAPAAAKQLITLFDDMIGLPRHKGSSRRKAASKAQGSNRFGLGMLALLLVLAAFLVIALVVQHVGDGGLPVMGSGTHIVEPTDTPVPTASPTPMPEGYNTLTNERHLLSWNKVLGSEYKQEYIYSIAFRSTLDNRPSGAWDVSLNSDGSVWAWVTDSGHADDKGRRLYHLTIAANGPVRLPESSASLFNGFTTLTSIDFGRNVDTSGVTDMSSMFYMCTSLRSLDLSGLDTSNVTSMWNMFSGCASLTSLDLSPLNTSQVTNMALMFANCSSLTSLNLWTFNTAQVTDMALMFVGCTSLTSLNLTNLNTSSVTDMSSMFANCSSIKSLDLSHFDTSNVTTMACMFMGCSSLKSLDLRSFNTSRVTSMRSMFQYCYRLETLDLSSFSVANVSWANWMFASCTNLLSVRVSERFITNFDAITWWMFDDCPAFSSVSDFTVVR